MTDEHVAGTRTSPIGNVDEWRFYCLEHEDIVYIRGTTPEVCPRCGAGVRVVEREDVAI